MLYACDLKWWRWHYKGVAQRSPTLRVTSDPEAPKEFADLGLRYIAGKHAPGFSTDPRVIHFGRNSGYQAINIALLAGAKRVLLLGFDHRHVQGASHWFGDHPDKLRSIYDTWLQETWSTVQPELLPAEVINCTPGSALTVFRLSELRNEI